MKKVVKIIVLVILIAVLVIPALFLGPYYLRVKHFEASPEQGFHADFFLYISPKAKKLGLEGKEITLLIQPNNSGNSDDPEFHRKDAWWMTFGRSGLADDLGVALLVPAFVRPFEDWHIYTHALDRDVFTTERTDLYRTDLQLLAMVQQVRESFRTEGFTLRDKFLIQGYSASGMFANRFSVLHPEKVLAVASGSPGGWPIAPTGEFKGATLNYPAGVSDLEKLTGKPFDIDAFQKIPMRIVMGSLDDNDALDFNDGWETSHSALVDSLFGDTPMARWSVSSQLYKEQVKDVKFILVDGVGHDRKALQHHTTEFFREVLQGD